MFVTARVRVSCICLTIAAICGRADAHNLFVMVDNRPDGPDSVDVIFEHSPRPGDGGYNKPLLDRGSTWVEAPNTEEIVPLKLEEVTKAGKKSLHAETTTKSPRAVVHNCKWGVYKGRLDYFSGKYLDVSSAAELSSLARTSKLPIDIVPAIESGKVKITVLFRGKPLEKVIVWIWTPDGKEVRQTTDADGSILLKNPAPGIYSFAAGHILHKPAGEFEGESYKGVMYVTTCTFRWPIE